MISLKNVFLTFSEYKKKKLNKEIKSDLENSIDKIKLHIGCGEINIPGWINIDARKFPHIHIIDHKIELDEFVDYSISEIYLCHVLEHFSFMEANQKLSLFHRKLKPGGKLYISVPDFNLIINGYKKSGNNLNAFRMALMGGQDYEFNFHKSIYDKKLLTILFSNVGFNKIEEWNPSIEFNSQFKDWSSKKLRIGLKYYPISLNLCAIKKI